MHSYDKSIILVGARGSNLSRAQVLEVEREIQQFAPEITFQPIWIETSGDKDLSTSLRQMEKTDFFTKEIDILLLEGRIQIGIHSAKDLPDPLPEGLVVVALTKGLTAVDVLVLRERDSFEKLPSGAKIATSSFRREKQIRELREDVCIVDVRGNIEHRLRLLDEGQIDGLVVAECALIRLQLTSRNRLTLNGPTAPLQGQLAIVARKTDLEMRQLFRSIDSRNLKIDDPSSVYVYSFSKAKAKANSGY